MRAEKGQKWKKPLNISIIEKWFFINRSQIFIAFPKFYVTHRIYEILSKSLVPNVGAQVVLPVIPRAAGRTRPQPGLGVLAVDVTLQALLVVKGLLAGLEKPVFLK